MSTADDMRDLRDALDSIAHGALPRWGATTTKLGGEAQAAAREVYEKFVRALFAESAAKVATDASRLSEDRHRAYGEYMTSVIEKLEAEVERLKDRCASYSEDVESLNGCVERLGAENTKLRAEVDLLRYERRMFRRRIAECLPWVGRVPYPNTPGFNEMIACRDLAERTLEEVPE
jgi:cell division protein FtsB